MFTTTTEAERNAKFAALAHARAERERGRHRDDVAAMLFATQVDTIDDAAAARWAVRRANALVDLCVGEPYILAK